MSSSPHPQQISKQKKVKPKKLDGLSNPKNSDEVGQINYKDFLEAYKKQFSPELETDLPSSSQLNDFDSDHEENVSSINMMKFPRPRTLTENPYPDITLTEPEIVSSIVSTVKPEENSPMDAYIQSSIDFIKKEQRDKKSLVVQFSKVIGDNLLFVDLYINGIKIERCLVDTGATNSLIHESIAKKLNLPMKPTSLKLSTATGVSGDAIKGISHAQFSLQPENHSPVSFCTKLIVSSKLNGLDAILGSEFLLDPSRVKSLNGKTMTVIHENSSIDIPLTKSPLEKIRSLHNIIFMQDLKSVDQEHSKNQQDFVECPKNHDIKYAKVQINNYNIQDDMHNETIPPSSEFFQDQYVIDHKILDKKYTILDGDFSKTPKSHLDKLLKLLKKYADRFSTSKLDIEQTTLYEAALPTIPGRKVVQPVRRLPPVKFQFAMKALSQLEKAGVISKSDSPWRSNVVLVPKPTSSSELRSNTKADQLTGKQHRSELYRICLDFRELNSILEFPNQTQFKTIDNFLHTLKGKKVVCLDISSSFFIIPIKKKDRYKTAFWVNDEAFEFNVLVMGLKSSPHYLNKFMKIAFDKETYDEFYQLLTPEEKLLVPSTFDEFIISYFDDLYVYADTDDQLLVCLKLVLQAARKAGIKFSIEKCSFMTTNFKILGYTYDTKETQLCMDVLKASAFQNMKKPSSLFELHSRLAAFQYQSSFLPYLKDILYPLHFLLRKKQFNWGKIEEMAWTQAKKLATLNLKLTVPDPSDELVLTTDASKIAASACLFRVRDNKLQLVAVSSKYFSSADLNKNSYTLEAISLAYALKVFAAYLLNCTSRIKIFTDAKSLIYAKRMSSHSILLNNTLNYLTNFVSLLNVDIYHLPGTVNVLADVLSRAIADNLNCSLPREHPISKQWAKVLPPIPDNFYVEHEVLYKFLTNPLQPETQDLHDRSHKKLMEPKTIQEAFDMSKSITPEERYHSALVMLEQWNSEYARKHSQAPLHLTHLFAAKLTLDVEKQKSCLDQVQKILEDLYSDIKDSKIYKQLQRNLVEASKKYLYVVQKPLTEESVRDFTSAVTRTVMTMSEIRDPDKIDRTVDRAMRSDFIFAYHNHTEIPKSNPETQPIVFYRLHARSQYLPKICPDSNGLDLPFQEDVILQPHQVLKVDLGVQFQLPKHFCALLMNKSSARMKYNISVTLGLIDIGYTNFLQTVIQNMSNEKVVLPAGTAVAQLLLLPSQIPSFENTWPQPTSDRGGFGSTGQDFELTKPLNQVNAIMPHLVQKETNYNSLLTLYDNLDNRSFKIEAFTIHLLGDNVQNSQDLHQLQSFEASLLPSSPVSFEMPPEPKICCFTSDINEECEKTSQFHQDPLTLTSETLSALLAADLLENKKLSIDSLIYFQTHDPYIGQIKETLLGKNDLKSFTLKKGVVCKIFQPKPQEPQKFVICLPDVLLLPTIIYIHKHFLHPSITQNFKEFSKLYYHPKARKTITRLCNACLVCKLSHNPSKRNMPVGSDRSLQPSMPRQMVSIDILYLPNSSQGHTHGLLIADLFSLYLSFFPLKSKSSTQVAAALRSFFSLQGTPSVIYSDNDTAFLGDCQTLFADYHVTHITSYPYNQQENAVESQVRKFKIAYRAAILDNPIFTSKEWHLLYPLVLIRLNTMISKYGLSREYVHYKEVLDQHLPLIVETKLDEELENDLSKIAYDFRGKIAKFLKNKEKSKKSYKQGQKYKFKLHELVMRKVYTTASAISPTFTGPFRILELSDKGAILRDPKTGTTCSAHYQNLRKLNIPEFLELLPQHFDAEILKYISKYRYNTTGPPDVRQNSTEKVNDEFLPDQEEHVDLDTRKLRSGKVIPLNLTKLPKMSEVKVHSACFSHFFRPATKLTPVKIPILKPKMTPEPTPYADLEQEFCNGTWYFSTTLHENQVLTPRRNYKSRFKSKFQSPHPGTLTITLDNEYGKEKFRPKKVSFKKIDVYFY